MAASLHAGAARQQSGSDGSSTIGEPLWLYICLCMGCLCPVHRDPWWPWKHWAYCRHYTAHTRWAQHLWAELDLVDPRRFGCSLQPLLLLSLSSFPARLTRPSVPATSSPGNSLNTVIKTAIWEEDQADCTCFSCYFSPVIPYVALLRKGHWDINSPQPTWNTLKQVWPLRNTHKMFLAPVIFCILWPTEDQI